MINLILAYYENIWPFQNKSCSLIFDEGKYLIKAPIWSWKSFLFFDAPCYALYKDSFRNMLNLHSKNGEISMIFESEWMYYLIKRILKSTRMGNDSCSSQLYSINYNWENLLKDIKSLTGNNEILQRWENYIKLFENENWKKRQLEEISFKNETDLQSTLGTFLPPKEVFLSTVFLLQDADNIFEMKPSDRLIVLKNVFDLLWIDDAKETVQDKKREIQYKLKALQDHSTQDEKLRTILKTLRTTIKNLESYDELKDILITNNTFFEDIEWFIDQLSISNFSLNWLNKNSFEKTGQIIQEKSEILIKLNTQIQELEQQKKSLLQQTQLDDKDIQSEINKINSLQVKIEGIDIKKWDSLKEKKVWLYNKASLLENQQDYQALDSLVDWRNNEIKDDETIIKQDYPKTLKQVYDFLQMLKDAWVKIKSNLEFEKVKLENEKLESKNWQENQNRKIEKLKDLKIRKDEEIQSVKDRIDDLDKWWSKISDFDCPELCKKCPHITAINKQQFEQYSQQKETLLQQIDKLEKEKNENNFDQEIEKLQKEPNPIGYEWCDLWIDLSKLIEKHTKFNEDLKNNLIWIGYNSWENKFKEWESFQLGIQKVDKDYLQWEEWSKHLEAYQQEKIAAESSLQHLRKQKEERLSGIHDLSDKIDKFLEEKQKINPLEIQEQQRSIKQISQSYTQLEQLIEDSINNQNLTKELEEKEKKLNRLYSIFSKDLVLLALDGYLPNLCDIINSYLNQCVDYTLNMCIIENWEKLELEAKVLDSKWEREVKSLSGWQKTVLKLVWMLAISSYLHTPLLFLDETINNLDLDTVGKVSEMINNFVKQRTMKFYTVTHNKEIQDMQIWDNIIEIDSINKENLKIGFN